MELLLEVVKMKLKASKKSRAWWAWLVERGRSWRDGGARSNRSSASRESTSDEMGGCGLFF